MPSSKAKSSRLNSDSNLSKFEEIQKKNLEVLKKRVQSFDESDEEDIETDKTKVDALFKNYQGNDSDVARIRQFFESGENIDCLICKRVHSTTKLLFNYFGFRHPASENQRQDLELHQLLLLFPPALHPEVGQRLDVSEANILRQSTVGLLQQLRSFCTKERSDNQLGLPAMSTELSAR